MYTFAQRLKITAYILMGLGFIGLVIGFASAPSTVAEAQAMVADAHGGHGDAHGSHGDAHQSERDAHAVDGHKEDKHHDAHAAEDTHGDSHHNDAHGDAHHDDAHGKHLLHQLQNKPWAALYVAAFFFFMIALGTLVFYAIQRAAQAGWPVLLYRVMEGITAYLVPGSIIIYVFLILTGLHANHLFVWMDAETVAHDEIIQGKVGYLNVPFFLIRAAIYLLGWNAYRYFSRKFSLAQDQAPASDIRNYKKNFRISAGFLVFFFVTESMMSWDWIMSLDPHWFSTLFGWYVLASMLVTAVTVIALVSIYLKSKGYLPKVNDSHLHDLAKFMFGLSVFWTYLWFSQFMLIWYSNIPEEVTYFLTRIDDYNLPFFGMVVMNFIFPLLILMSSDYKRSNWIIVMTGIIIVLGHYIDIFNMIMPATVGDHWFIGWAEIGGFLFFAGLFIYVVFRALTKAPLEASGDPFIGESERFVY
jgi:hypothetical protein